MTNNIALLEFESNPNIGLFIFANDKFALIGKEIDKEKKKKIQEILKVPVYEITINNTELVGVFINGNNQHLIIPEIEKYEYEKLGDICKKHSVEIIKINENNNTFGNLMTLTEDEIICSEQLSKNTIKKIKEKTKLKTIIFKENENGKVGGIIFSSKNKLFASQELEEKEIEEFIEKVVGIGTINGGSQYISSGVVANSNGILIGSNSTTIEIQEIVEKFQYL